MKEIIINGFLDDADSLKAQLTEVRQWVVRTAMGEDTTAEELARIIYTLDEVLEAEFTEGETNA